MNGTEKRRAFSGGLVPSDVDVAVTGAGGFLGRALVAALGRDGAHRVFAVEGNVLEPASLSGLASADAVVHLAALASPRASARDPQAALSTNLLGTIHVARAMRPGARLVFASTAQVYGRSNGPCQEAGPIEPRSVYAATKLAAEGALLALADAIDPVVLRFFNVYGPGQSTEYVVGRALQGAREGAVRLAASAPVRDLVYIDDAVEAIVRAVSSRASARVINVATGRGTAIGEMAALVGKIAGVPVSFESSGDPDDRLVGDATRAREALGWRAATGLEEGLARSFTRP